MNRKNFRDMSDKELEHWRREVLEMREGRDPGEEHRRALRTMQNPVRREIVTLLKNQAETMSQIANQLDLDEKTLQYHLQFLKDIFFISVQEDIIDLTPLGVAYSRNVL